MPNGEINGAELDRIQAQAQLLAWFIAPFLNGLFQTVPHPVILDVGCGDGTYAALSLKNRKPKAYLGIGSDETLIRLANARYGDDITHFVTADMMSSDFMNVVKQELGTIGATKADFIMIPMLLSNIEDPVDLLTRLREVLQPTGVILIINVDVWDNRVSDDKDALFAAAHTLIKQGLPYGNQQAGRYIPSWLLKAGYHNIQYRCGGLSTQNMPDEGREAMYTGYFGLAKLGCADANDIDWCAENLPRIRRQLLNSDVWFTLGLRAYTAQLEAEQA